MATISGPRWIHLQPVGKIDEGGPIPAGLLYVGRTEQLGDRQKKWLVVDLAQPTPGGERSFVAAAVPNCWGGTLSVAYHLMYADALGEGALVSHRLYQPQLEIPEPNETLKSAIRESCKRG